MSSSNMEDSSSILTNSAGSENETVTSLTAKSLDPGKAVATIYSNREGLLYSLWRPAAYLLLEAFGLNKSSKGIHEDYEHADLEAVAARGNFRSRPSDLFLKVRN
jgi:hypothetical protein